MNLVRATRTTCPSLGLFLLMLVLLLLPAFVLREHADAAVGGYAEVQVQTDGSRFSYLVFHAIDRDGFCDAAAFGAVSLHPVLTDAPNDTMVDATTGQPAPRATIDFFIDWGDGVIVETSGGPASGTRNAIGVRTFSTYDNSLAGSPVRAFSPLVAGLDDECQAWVKVASPAGRPVNVFIVFHDDAGDIGFDRLINPPPSTQPTITLTPRWTLVNWSSLDTTVESAVAGLADPGRLEVIYGWNDTTNSWAAYFPASGPVPGPGSLTTLRRGQPYWVAVSGTTPLSWTVLPG